MHLRTRFQGTLYGAGQESAGQKSAVRGRGARDRRETIKQRSRVPQLPSFCRSEDSSC